MSGWGSQRTATATWRRLRATILKRDGYTCVYPGCHNTATDVDHITPHHKGGSDHPTNLQSLCAYHHRIKTAIEANAAKQKQTRSPEPHPGLTR